MAIHVRKNAPPGDTGEESALSSAPVIISLTPKSTRPRIIHINEETAVLGTTSWGYKPLTKGNAVKEATNRANEAMM